MRQWTSRTPRDRYRVLSNVGQTEWLTAEECRAFAAQLLLEAEESERNKREDDAVMPRMFNIPVVIDPSVPPDRIIVGDIELLCRALRSAGFRA